MAAVKSRSPATQQDMEMEMKTIAFTALALILSNSFGVAQESQVRSRADSDRPSGYANEKPGVNSGMPNSERTEPGDFAVTDGLSRGRSSNPTGQVDPGTSNAPGPNSGGK
jgi:hypothetical protein